MFQLAFTPVIHKLKNMNVFKQELSKPSLFQIAVWWEVRRVFYNLTIGITGIFSLIVCVVIEYLFPKELEVDAVFMPDSPLFAIFLYCIMANILYTGGEITEMLVRKIWKDKAEHYGEISFSLGLLLSILITLSPIFLFIVIVV